MPLDKKGGQTVMHSRLVRLPSFLNSIQAISIPVRGCPFTWKKRVHGHLIYEKLDRALGRQDWCQLYPDSIVYDGPFTCSDHTYIILNTRATNYLGKSPFSVISPTGPHMRMCGPLCDIIGQPILRAPLCFG